ncbi:MAG TPA: hypothetical protein VJ747_12500 [Stellaceae bacterium]|nr:hypothetical protein [Stellaceae bacterium]
MAVFSPWTGDPYSTGRAGSTERRFQAFIPRMSLERPLALVLPLLTLAGLLAGCAPAPSAGEAVPSVDTAADIPPIPICRDEMRAFVELAHLAKQHGDGWVVFEPAVDALKQQIIDCIDVNRDRFRGL